MMNVCRVFFVVLFALVGVQPSAFAAESNIDQEMIQEAIKMCQQQSALSNLSNMNDVNEEALANAFNFYRGCSYGVLELVFEAEKCKCSIHSDDAKESVELSMRGVSTYDGIREGIRTLRALQIADH